MSTLGDEKDLLSSLLNKKLHVHTTDGRKFVGDMKCTDPERNIILSMTQEYRQRQQDGAHDSVATQDVTTSTSASNNQCDKRFVGLVVVPGRFITKIEVEE